MNRSSLYVICGGFLSIIACAILWSNLIDQPGFLPNISQEFKVGFAASLWEDILFFLFVTVAIFIAQYLNRTPDSFHSKMKTIFGNMIPYTDSLHSFVNRRISPIFSYFDRVSIQLEILDVSDDRRFVDIQTIRKIFVGNLSSDVVAKHRLEIRLDPEDVHGGVPKLFDIESAQTDASSGDDPEEREIIYSGRDIDVEINDYGPEFEIPCGKFRWYKLTMKSREDISKTPGLIHVTQSRYIKFVDITVRNSSRFRLRLRSITSNGSSEIILDRHTDRTFRPSINDNPSDTIYKVEVVSIEE